MDGHEKAGLFEGAEKGEEKAGLLKRLHAKRAEKGEKARPRKKAGKEKFEGCFVFGWCVG